MTQGACPNITGSIVSDPTPIIKARQRITERLPSRTGWVCAEGRVTHGPVSVAIEQWVTEQSRA
jgi:hypothetical protein